MKLALALIPIVLGAADRLLVPLGLDQYVPAPVTNPLRRESVELGRKLFFDKRLSRDSTIACASCHNPALAFTDNRPLGVGVGGRKGARRSPPILNRAWGRSFFWDGRVATLEEQVLQPIVHPAEMDQPLDRLLARLDSDPDYRQSFLATFGSQPEAPALARALASYVRTILSGDSPYDRYVAGETDALTPDQKAGLRLFRGKANCATCHAGPNLTDEDFHNTGVGWHEGKWTDVGREGRGAFKTPSLREAARIAPYMHDGSLATLEEVIDFYDKGGRENPGLDPEIRRLGLSADEKRALVTFLHSLSGRILEGWPQ